MSEALIYKGIWGQTGTPSGLGPGVQKWVHSGPILGRYFSAIWSAILGPLLGSKNRPKTDIRSKDRIGRFWSSSVHTDNPYPTYRPPRGGLPLERAVGGPGDAQFGPLWGLKGNPKVTKGDKRVKSDKKVKTGAYTETR